MSELSQIAKNIVADSLVTAASGGTLRMMSKTKEVIADFSIPSPAGTVVDGTINFDAPSAAVAISKAIASQYWVYDKDSVPLWDGSIGTAASGADMTLNSVDISIGAYVSIKNWTRTVR
jgi:hypothetical protein